MSKTDIKTLRQAVKDAEAKAKEADELVRSVRARLSEVQRDAMDANKALYDAQIALKAAGPLGKRLTEILREAAEPSVWCRVSDKRLEACRELEAIGFVTIIDHGVGWRVSATDAGRAKLAESAP